MLGICDLTTIYFFVVCCRRRHLSGDTLLLQPLTFDIRVRELGDPGHVQALVPIPGTT